MLIVIVGTAAVIVYSLIGAVVYGRMVRRRWPSGDAAAIATFWPLFGAVEQFIHAYKLLARFGMWVTEPRAKKTETTIPTAKVVQK